jgi:hypothetical protein
LGSGGELDYWFFGLLTPKAIGKLIAIVLMGLILLYLYSLGDRETRLLKFIRGLKPRGQAILGLLGLVVLAIASLSIFLAIEILFGDVFPEGI